MKMEYKDFLKIAESVSSPISERRFLEKTDRLFAWQYRKGKKEVELPDNKIPVYLYAEACIGGMAGTGYDGTLENRPSTNPEGTLEVQRDFDYQFDSIVEKICPDILFLKYKILASIIQSTSYTTNGYYGESSIYTVLYIKLRDMWKKLIEMGLVE